MKEIKPGYKETPIGILPKDWEVKSLGEVGNFLKGKGISKNDISNDGIECIRYGELYTTYNEVINKVVSKTNIELSELIFSEKNDVIIPSSGETALDIARASCILIDNIALGGDLNIFRGDMNGKYLSYYINSLGKIRLSSYAQGASVIHLYSNSLKNFLIPIPPKEEQEKIAQILMTWDEAIEKQEELIEQEKEFKKGMMQKIFSQELRFKDENGNDYPEWEEKKLGDISSNIMYGMNAAATEFDGQNKYIRITDISEASNKFIPNPLSSPLASLEERFLVNENDILFARTGASTGKSYLYDSKDGILYYAGFLIRFNINKENNSKYIFYQTLTKKYQNWLKIMSMRSGQPGINAEEYKGFEMDIPSLPEQEKIADFLSTIDEKIDVLEKKLEELKEQKKGLMQKLLTGEVRVKS